MPKKLYRKKNARNWKNTLNLLRVLAMIISLSGWIKITHKEMILMRILRILFMICLIRLSLILSKMNRQFKLLVRSIRHWINMICNCLNQGLKRKEYQIEHKNRSMHILTIFHLKKLSLKVRVESLIQTRKPSNCCFHRKIRNNNQLANLKTLLKSWFHNN